MIINQCISFYNFARTFWTSQLTVTDTRETAVFKKEDCAGTDLSLSDACSGATVPMTWFQSSCRAKDNGEQLKSQNLRGDVKMLRTLESALRYQIWGLAGTYEINSKMTEKKTYSHGYWAENSKLKMSTMSRTYCTTDSGVFLSYFLLVMGLGILSCHWLKPHYYSLGHPLCIHIVSFLISLSEEYLSLNLGLLWGPRLTSSLDP